MNVLLVSEYFPSSSKAERKGGAESNAYYIARELAKKHDVVVLCSRQPENKEKINRFENLTVYRVGPKIPYAHHSYVFRRILFCISASLKGLRIKADLVHGFSFLSYNIAIFISIFKRIPRIATYHETWIGEWSKNKPGFTGLMGGIFEKATLFFRWDRIIAVSNFTKNELIEGGVKGKVRTIYNGIDAKKFEEIKKEVGQEQFKDPTIICISRLTPQKRVIDLVQSISLVKKKIPNIRCKIVGVGDELEKIIDLIKELGVDKNIELVGYVEKYENVLKMLCKSHIFALASELEGFGIVVVEAMALGVPYVATDIAPIKEVTENGKGGLLFRARDYNDLAEKILILFEKKQLYETKKSEGKELVKRYNWEKLGLEVDEVYREVTK